MGRLGEGVKWNAIQNSLVKEGYQYQFACDYSSSCPSDLSYTGHENGWETRRKIKAWCKSKGITDYRILRNGGYVSDLHGDAVYELYVRDAQP